MEEELNPLKWKEDVGGAEMEMHPMGQQTELNMHKHDSGPDSAAAVTAVSQLMLAELPDEEDEETAYSLTARSEECIEERDTADMRQFRIFCPDLERWFVFKCWNPLLTIQDIKQKMFHATGVHPFCNLPSLLSLVKGMWQMHASGSKAILFVTIYSVKIFRSRTSSTKGMLGW